VGACYLLVSHPAVSTSCLRSGPLLGGWSGSDGRGWWGTVGGVEGAGPGVLPGPGLGQVPGDGVVSAAGGSARDADELGADGGAAGHGVAGGGQRAEGPGEGVGGGGELEPGGVGGKRSRGKVGQWSLDQVGEDMLVTACPRWSDSAWTSGKGLSVNTAW